MKSTNRYRWVVVAIFFGFMLLHQSDKLLIGPLTTPIMETFGIDEAQMGLIFSGALIVGAFMYPIWGFLFDRFARNKLLALASAIWGSTTWLSAIAPTYGTFLLTRASTGVDDSSYPGLFSLISDYFGPETRGKVYGILQLSMPLGYLIGVAVATLLGGTMGWRNIFFVTGALGLVMAVVIYFAVKEPPRGQAEPEMQGIEETGTYRFEWQTARGLFRKRTLIPLYLQGFVGVFPWQVITFWFFRYLETERGYGETDILVTMAPTVLILASGYVLGGAAGDWAFKRTPRGRLLISMIAVLIGAILLPLTLSVPLDQKGMFLGMLMLTAIAMPIASPNVISTVYDITLPEVRSTAISIQYFIENLGAATAPALAGLIARESSLGFAILGICVSAWLVGSLFLGLAAYLVPSDIKTLRKQMSDRADQERSLQEAPAVG